MIRLSTRFAAGLLLLLGAAAVIRLGALRGAKGEDVCASPGALKATSLIRGTTALGERLEKLDAETLQWSEGEVVHPFLAKLPMRFQIVRSYDAPSLYLHPLELGALPERESARPRADDASSPAHVFKMQPEELRVRDLISDGAHLPIHVAWDHTEAPRGPSRLVAWFFVFDNEPVRSPLSAQLANSLNLALGGPRPLTLVTISALALEPTVPRVEDAAVAWLSDAWGYVARSCEPR